MSCLRRVVRRADKGAVVHLTDLDLMDIALDEAARTTERDRGASGGAYRCFVSRRADYAAFRHWLERQLQPDPADVT